MSRYCIGFFIFTLLFSSTVVWAAEGALFSNEERDWLKAHPTLSIVVNDSPAPISFWSGPQADRFHAPPPPPTQRLESREPQFPLGHPPLFRRPGDPRGWAPPQPLIPVTEDEQKFFQGLARDYLQELSAITGVEFSIKYLSLNSFPEIERLLRNSKIDMTPAIQRDPGSTNFFNLSEPYIRVPLVVVMSSDHGYIKHVSQLVSKKVAGTLPVQGKIRDLGLDIQVQHVSPHEGLMGVTTGRFDAFIGELAGISLELETTPVNNIKIVGELPAAAEFCIAVSDEMKPFLPIFHKAIGAIGEKEKEQLWRKWFHIDYGYAGESRAGSYQLVIIPIGIVALLLGGLVLFYYRRRLNTIRHGLAALESHLLYVNIDQNITITNVTDALCRATGFTEADLIGKPLQVLGVPRTEPAIGFSEIFSMVEEGKTWRGEIKLVKKDGSELWTDVTISPSRRKDDTFGYTVLYQDATKRKKLEKLATRDELTSLFNRRYFNDKAAELLEEAESKRRIFCLVLFDVDNFKKYNDRHGHPAGDRVLAAIGKSLRTSLQREEDLCFRLGGEEFGVVTLLSSQSEASGVAERICRGIRDLKIPHHDNPPTNIVTVSAGIKTRRLGEAIGIEEIYKLADACLYQAKKNGRNGYVVDS